MTEELCQEFYHILDININVYCPYAGLLIPLFITYGKEACGVG
jgi:hypothetical protein